MRIIAGTFRSRQLKPVRGLALRPTSDMLRETLFNILGPRIEDSRFLDLFAGTGAVGIEAISRGATAVFVENHAATLRLLRENLAALGITSAGRILAASVSQALAKLQSEASPAFDFVFLDPPYANELDYHSILQTLAQSLLLDDSAIVVAEHYKKFSLPKSFGCLQQFRTLAQGDAVLSFYRPVTASTP